MSETFIIAGAGQCAGQAVATLRQDGFKGRVVLVGEEPHPPYQRPPLSKRFLSGELPLERVYLRPLAFYESNDVELRLNTKVECIHRNERRVDLDDGAALQYDKLLLATGSRPRELDLPGVNLPGIHYLRRISDAEHIQKHLKPGKKMIVVGGGYIGLEVTAVGIQAGLDVTVLEMQDRILNRVTSPTMSDYVATIHRENRVDIRCNVQLEGFEGPDRVERVVCSDGKLDADLVVIGIGILPNVELAEAAGLECNNGIRVDEYCRTADENIFAAGDCTNHPNSLLGRRLRLESVHNAMAQGKTAAANLGGERRVYAETPWFWSDQYDVKLQIAGLSEGFDQLVQRGNMEDKSFVLFYLEDGVLIAADAVNNPRDFMACRNLVSQKLRIAPERLSDTTVTMQEMASPPS